MWINLENNTVSERNERDDTMYYMTDSKKLEKVLMQIKIIRINLSD